MNKKGFTLIELLAVIVILAVIALIATPLITNTIQTSRKNADREGARAYISAIEEKITESMLEYPNLVVGGSLTASTDTAVRAWPCTNCGEGKTSVSIDFKGTAPQKVALNWANGKITGKMKYVNGCWSVDAKGNLTDISASDTSFCG